MASNIKMRRVAAADVPTPEADKIALFMDDATGEPSFKDEADAVTTLKGTNGSTGATGAGYGGTSTTSLAIGTGSKAFTTAAGKAWVAGSRVRAASNADPDGDWMEGVVSSYSGTTLTVLMDLVAGSGTHTDWNLTLGGERGATGPGVGGPMVVAKVYNSATQTVTDNPSPPTVLAMNSTDFDPEGYKSGNKFVVPVGQGGVPFELTGGTFSATVNTGSVSAPEADLFLAWFINGAMVRGGNRTATQPTSTSNPGQPVGYVGAPVTMVELADGDEVELRVYIDNDGASMVFGHASNIEAQTWMALKRLVGAVGTPGADGADGSAVDLVSDAILRTAADVTTGSTSFTDLTGASITKTTDAHRVLLTFTCATNNSGANANCFDFLVDGVRVSGATFGFVHIGNALSTQVVTMVFLTDVLSAGAHTFKVQWRVTAGTGTVYGATSTSTYQFAASELYVA